MLRAEAIADMYEKDEKLWDSFDSILMKYLENCVKLYSTEEGKKNFFLNFLEELINDCVNS